MEIGKEFFTRPNNSNKILQKYNDKYYLIEEKNIITNESRSDILYTEEEITQYLNDQKSIIEKVNKAIEYHKKMLELEREEQEKQRIIKLEYNNTFGYADNFPPMKKGKILKVLNTKEKYSNYGILSRKDFIYKAITEGYKATEKHDVKYHSSRNENGYTIKETEYQLHFEGYYNSITKIEYDLYLYLINKLVK